MIPANTQEVETPIPGRLPIGILPAAERIAAFSCGFDAARLDEADRILCGRSLADTYAVAAAGRNEHAAQAALRYLAGAGLLLPAGSLAPAASLWGLDERAAPEVAAWWNGVAGHVLDYDDVTVPMRGHPSVVLWPALLALAESRGLQGDRLAPAYAVGMEVICKFSRGIALDHYAAGWHSTASIGALGSTVACAHLLGLDATQVGHAIGLAVAQIAGSRENVGTEAKSFQAGHANAVAVRAACLAEAGFEAGPHAIDGPHGYLRLYADNADISVQLGSLGDSPIELRTSGLDIKQYPMCYATHRALDAVLALRRTHNLHLADVERVDVLTNRGALIPLVHPYPQTGLEGKFSMPYAMAAALSKGAVRLNSFVDDAVQQDAIQAFLHVVHAVEADGPPSPRWAEVTLTLYDGRRLIRRVSTLHGSTQDPLGEAELVEKIDDCLRWGGGDPRGKAVLAACLRMSDCSARELVALLQNTTQMETQ